MATATAPKTGPEDPLPLASAVSMKTLPMCGLLVDVYGLDEIPAGATRVSCLWLHHQRTQNKEHMADIAARCVSAWNDRAGRSSERGLIALAFDQRNHGSRIVHLPANSAWRGGNALHAQDMFGTMAGTVADQVGLIDAVEGYLFHDHSDKTGGKTRVIDQHLALGVSLGGHSVWQLMFADPRVRAGVIVVGCPDFMNLLSDRARLSKLRTWSAEDKGASFLGSKDFPPALIEACRKMDPKALFFGTAEVSTSASSSEDETRQKQILLDRLQGKKLLLQHGETDRLVPYRCSEPFLRWFKEATSPNSRFSEEGGVKVSVDDRIYPGVGHVFSPGMIRDAIEFVTDAVAQKEVSPGSPDQRASKI